MTEFSPAADASSSALAVAITSGKGGVGKTNISANLGIALAQEGRDVCVFDADTSLANINILLGLEPSLTLDHLIRGEHSLDEIILHGPERLDIIPAASGIAEYANLSVDQQNILINALETLEQRYDYLLIDTAAGISESVLRFIESAQYAVVVISPEPTSLTDAFSLIKVLHKRGYQQPIYVLVNMASNYSESMEVYKRFAHAANKYIHTKVRYLGYIPLDREVRDAVSQRQPVVLNNPDSAASRCIKLLANILIKHFSTDSVQTRKISQFWRELQPSTDEGHRHDLTPENDAAVSTPAEQISHQDQLVNPSDTHEETPPTEEPSVMDPSLYPNEESAAIMESPAGTMDQTSEHRPQQSAEQRQLAADELLAQQIKDYLAEFGALPQQAIHLILQANSQGQLPDSAFRALFEQYQEENGFRSYPESSGVTVTSSQDDLDQLVDEARKTKEALINKATQLRNICLDLYNQDISRPGQRVERLKTSAADDLAGLTSAMQFASGRKSNQP